METSSVHGRRERLITLDLSEREHQALYNILYCHILKREMASPESLPDSETGLTGAGADALLQKLENDL